jgi:hypothetical protein
MSLLLVGGVLALATVAVLAVTRLPHADLDASVDHPIGVGR